MSKKLRFATDSNGRRYLYHWCPGCKQVHGFPFGDGQHPVWTFDGNNDAPTTNPSIKLSVRNETLCHYWLQAGKIKFEGDCRHELRGQVVDLPDWPYAPGEYGGIED